MKFRNKLIAVLMLFTSVFSIGAANAATLNAVFPMYKQANMKGLTGDLSSAGTVIRACLLDMDDLGTALTGATNATPIVATSTSHGISNGDLFVITKVLGNTASNGIFRAASVTTDTFALVDPVTGANVAGNGAYTSGGRVWKLTGVDFLDDIASGARIGTPATVATKTVSTEGVFDAADTTISAVTGDQAEAILVYKFVTNDADSVPMLVIAGASSGLPVTPNGGDINITWPA